MNSTKIIRFYNVVTKIVLVVLYSIGLWILGASITAGVFTFHVAVVPLIFKYSKTFRRTLIFANFVQWPLFTNYDEPSSRGVDGARNISIEYESKIDNCHIKLGIWHILPWSAYDRLKGRFSGPVDKEELNKLMDKELAESKTPIVMYCHGNSNNRATAHRIQLYKFFQRMDFHTIAFDYRGYGDSTQVNPSEAGVVEDTLVVYEWLLGAAGRTDSKPPVYIWGHSLGTGISSSMLGNLEKLSTTLLDRQTPLPLPNGLILEAPFNNLADEIQKHPLSMLVNWLPYFDVAFVEPFRTSAEHKFETDSNLRQVKSLPILILHAKDDLIVPFLVGRKLYQSVLECRSDKDAEIRFHAYEKAHNLGHKNICLANDLPTVVGEFVTNHE